MIDTVVLRIHDIKLHIRLAEFLTKKANGTGKTINQKIGSEDFSIQAKLTHKTFITYHDTGNLYEVAHFNHLPSSHYHIAYKIDYIRDFIEFNISIPKYIYGTNVVQFLPNPLAANFNLYFNSTLQNAFVSSWGNLEKFIGKFIKTEFGEIEVYKSFTEINRIDLCYNQVFHSKTEALEYIKQAKRVKKKFSRDTSNYSRSWETSLMYKTDMYSFKIYHKGSEYRANDKKKHNEINYKAGKQVFDTAFYQDFADKIVRYEMTIRNKYMSYVFMNKIFRKDCHIWNDCKELYKEYRNKNGKQDDSLLIWKRTLEPEQLKKLDYIKNMINKSKKFYISDKNQNRSFDIETDEYFIKVAGKKERFEAFSLFSENLFNELSKKFLSILSEFELELFQDKTDIINKAVQHNERVNKERSRLKKSGIDLPEKRNRIDKKISISKISVALELLKTYNFSEIDKTGMYSRQTWYNIRKDLELLGVKETSILDLTVNAKFDLMNYFNDIIYNQRKITNLNFVN